MDVPSRYLCREARKTTKLVRFDSRFRTEISTGDLRISKQEPTRTVACGSGVQLATTIGYRDANLTSVTQTAELFQGQSSDSFTIIIVASTVLMGQQIIAVTVHNRTKER